MQFLVHWSLPLLENHYGQQHNELLCVFRGDQYSHNFLSHGHDHPRVLFYNVSHGDHECGIQNDMGEDGDDRGAKIKIYLLVDYNIFSVKEVIYLFYLITSYNKNCFPIEPRKE